MRKENKMTKARRGEVHLFKPFPLFTLRSVGGCGGGDAPSSIPLHPLASPILLRLSTIVNSTNAVPAFENFVPCLH